MIKIPAMPTPLAIENVARLVSLSKGEDPDGIVYRSQEWPLPSINCGPTWKQYETEARTGLIAAAYLLRFGPSQEAAETARDLLPLTAPPQP